MSFSVLVIPEDPHHNGHILKPLVNAILESAGKPYAKVNILQNPRLRGYDHAVYTIRHDLFERYRYKDLWLFFPDADRATADAMDALEEDVGEQDVWLLCSAAQPELEIYACAAFLEDLPEHWDDVRRHPRMKEDIFDPLLRRYGDPRRPGAGRDLMVGQSLRNLRRLFQLCPELRRLRDRIAAHLEED